MARILVAEDDAGVRQLVARALRLEGHEVDLAEDGEMALDQLIAEDGAYDLLLSDIRMPAMDGIALAHRTAETWPDLTILLMTGYAEQKESAEELRAIIVGVVDKPFTLAEIRSAVARSLQASGEEPLRLYA
ncbi:response regulator [Mangrovibrevibacter kandeliae]|uniref:response regulator n=1 Tax=Mangrovibrevibacter kandeliae TaxID=2968473 RepID=UPI002119168C|nr:MULTISPECIES: response regulator [unclassified Aurantimonas]MCQ8783834.1 response regulator [Aurantimonas sp. CSK15Z-1]MCW4116555.1 response regulator [Aurantimonas sp. MSK8Z-1]